MCDRSSVSRARFEVHTYLAVLIFVSTFLLLSTPVYAQSTSKDRAAMRKGIDAVERFDAGNFVGAEALLHGIINACANSCSKKVIAGLYMYRGLAKAKAAGKAAEALPMFREALNRDPHLALDDLRSDHETQSMYRSLAATKSAPVDGPPILVNEWRAQVGDSASVAPTGLLSPSPPTTGSKPPAGMLSPPGPGAPPAGALAPASSQAPRTTSEPAPIDSAAAEPAPVTPPAAATPPPPAPPAPVATPPSAAPKGTVPVHFVAKGGKNLTVTSVDGASCQTPCRLDLPPGNTTINISGDALFTAFITVPSTESTFLVKTKSAGLAITGGIMAVVGTTGLLIDLAVSPDSTAVGPLLLFASVSLTGCVLMLASGKNKLKHQPSATPQYSLGASPLPGGGAAGAFSMQF